MKNNKDYLDILKKKYSLLNQSSEEYKKVGWGSEGTQRKRFEVLLGIANLRNKKILDLGCGLGHLLNFINEKKIQCDYFGIDVQENMIEIAVERHSEIKFSVNSIDSIGLDQHYDYIFSSGIFTFSDLKNFKYHIQKMFSLAKYGIAFNTLSKWGNKSVDNEFQADPVKTLEYCKAITPNITLRHDYLPHDFTIYMYKQVE